MPADPLDPKGVRTWPVHRGESGSWGQVGVRVKGKSGIVWAVPVKGKKGIGWAVRVNCKQGIERAVRVKGKQDIGLREGTGKGSLNSKIYNCITFILTSNKLN